VADVGPVQVVSTGEEARAVLGSQPPDVVILDVMLKGEDGLEVGAELLAERASLKIVIVTALQEQSLLREALALGFHGYIPKDTPAQQFVRAIAAVAEGQVVFSQRLADPRGEGPPEHRDAARLAEHLTERERDVLALLAQGLSGHDIGRELHIGGHTVRKHIQNIMGKLHVHSRLEAAAFAVRYRLLSDHRRAPVTSPPGREQRKQMR
jgi:DNA-binding NarL/FixJ family response regulator